MGYTEFEINSKEMTGDESVQIATKCSNVITVGWNLEADGESMSIDIGFRVNDTGQHIINALASLAANAFAQMAKGDTEKEMHMTAAMMESIADRQAKRFSMDTIERFRKAGTISSVTS